MAKIKRCSFFASQCIIVMLSVVVCLPGIIRFSLKSSAISQLLDRKFDDEIRNPLIGAQTIRVSETVKEIQLTLLFNL